MIVYEEAKDEDQPPPMEEAEARIPPELRRGRINAYSACSQSSTLPNRRRVSQRLRCARPGGIRDRPPSTYAPTMAVLQERGYVIRDQKRLVPTETGILVNAMISEHFPNIVDTGFTANMEADLDRIAAVKFNGYLRCANSTGRLPNR